MELFFLSVAVWWMKHRIYTAPHLRVSAYVCYILNYMSHNMNSPPQPFVNLNIIFTTTRWVTVWWRWRCFAITRTLTPVLHFRSDAQRSNKQKERKKLELERQVFNADHFSASEEAGFPSSLVRHGSSCSVAGRSNVCFPQFSLIFICIKSWSFNPNCL